MRRYEIPGAPVQQRISDRRDKPPGTSASICVIMKLVVSAARRAVRRGQAFWTARADCCGTREHRVSLRLFRDVVSTNYTSIKKIKNTHAPNTVDV